MQKCGFDSRTRHTTSLPVDPAAWLRTRRAKVRLLPGTPRSRQRILAATLRTSHDAVRLCARAQRGHFLGSSKGRTRAFGSRNRGSNPRPRAFAGLPCWCKARSYKPVKLGSIPRPRTTLHADRDSWCWSRSDKANTRSPILRRSTKRNTEGEGSVVGYRPRNPGMLRHWRSTRPPSSRKMFWGWGPRT